MNPIYIREGSTAQIPFQLLGNNTPINLTGMDKIEIVLVPENGQGASISFNTDDDEEFVILDPIQGKVGFTPGSGTFDHLDSPYKVYFWVHVNGTSKFAVPDENDLVIEVTNDYQSS